MTIPHRSIPAACAPLLAALCLGATAPRIAGQSTSQPRSQSELAAAIAQARADSARTPYTQADIDFMSGMIHHHAQAIVMSRWAATHGASSSVQTLAARIINAQGDEIHLMQQWLRERNQPVPEPTPTGMPMKMNGTTQVMLMPGMLTEDQMNELDAARGTDFDRKFLTFMIQHHSGAIEMVKTLFGTEGAAQDPVVFKFASDVNVDQSTEIVRMQRMLVELALETGSPR